MYTNGELWRNYQTSPSQYTYRESTGKVSWGRQVPHLRKLIPCFWPQMWMCSGIHEWLHHVFNYYFWIIVNVITKQVCWAWDVFSETLNHLPKVSFSIFSDTLVVDIIEFIPWNIFLLSLLLLCHKWSLCCSETQHPPSSFWLSNKCFRLREDVGYCRRTLIYHFNPTAAGMSWFSQLVTWRSNSTIISAF